MIETMKKTSHSNHDVRTVVALLFVLIVLSAIAVSGKLFSAERSILLFLNSFPASFDIIMINITHFGSLAALYSSVFVILILGRKKLALGLLGAGMLAYLSAAALKAVVMQPRPAARWPEIVAREWGPVSYGFPSGHAALVTAMAVTLWPYVSKPYRPLLIILAVLVSLSRVTLGMHFIIDVIGGAVIGMIAAIVIRIIMKYVKIKD